MCTVCVCLCVCVCVERERERERERENSNYYLSSLPVIVPDIFRVKPELCETASINMVTDPIMQTIRTKGHRRTAFLSPYIKAISAF